MLGQSAEDHGEAVREVLVHLLLLKAMSYQGLQAGGDGLQGVGNLLICIGSGLVLDMGLEGGVTNPAPCCWRMSNGVE